MITVEYNFRLASPLHTGSDVNAGVMRHLRRQKVVLPEPETYESRLSEDDRREAVVQIALAVWRAIDKSEIKGKRLMGIWDEFAAKLTAAARQPDKYRFFDALCRSWGIRSCTSMLALNALELLDSRELLDIVREECLYIVLKLRALSDEAHAHRAESGGPLAYEIRPVQALETPLRVVRTTAEIPCISGNSIRGKLRRLAMHDFLRRIGVRRLDRRVYHTLFSGGFLDASSTYEDFEKLDRLVAMNPMLALFGAAVGDMMIEGDLQVGWAYPLCVERGTGERSVWEFLDTVFQTRRDSSKWEEQVEIVDDEAGEGAAQQMKYEYEVFAPGTVFEHRFALLTEDRLRASAFAHLLDLFRARPVLGGNSAVGCGDLDLSGLPTLDGADPSAYLEYLADRAAEMREFWETLKI